MQITVELFSYFKENRFEQKVLQLAANAKVTDLLAQLNIAPTDVGVIVINGAPGTIQKGLNDGDKVTLIPIIGGG